MSGRDILVSEIDDDTVECLYFATRTSTTKETENFYLRNLCENINKLIRERSIDYIWHKDTFEVVTPVLNENAQDLPCHLFSSTCFGDNIEDEWFIVYLILEITREFDDLVVQVKDNEGYFLLIEAADHLSSWAKPEAMENRVYVYRKQIHVIPPSVVSLNKKLSVSEAIRIIVNDTEKTLAAVEIQEAILRRIGNYPQKIQELFHRAIVRVPTELATVLKLKPPLISPIVHAYCNHDVIDLKKCKNLDYTNYVNVKVTFTKCLYAMLLHSKVLKKNSTFSNNNDKACNLGLKLSYGYKIIMNKATSDIYLSKGYSKFLTSLKVNGYFKGNVEGSRDYKCLLEQANNFYMSTLCPTNESVSNMISALQNTEEFKTKRDSIQNSDETALGDDDDSWLNINPEQLDEMLNTRYGKKVNLNSELTAEKLTSELTKFLEKTSDFEGIETNTADDNDAGTIEFDSNTFANALQNILDQLTNEPMETEKSTDNSDYSENEDNDFDQDNLEECIDKEIKAKLKSDNILNDNVGHKATFNNLTKSLKEEKAFSGPSSNILRNIGLSKTDILDSDDDEDFD